MSRPADPSNSSVGQKLVTPEVDTSSLMGTFGIRKEQVCSKGADAIQTVIASSSGICSAPLQVVFFCFVVLSGLCGCANAHLANAVRAKFQGEFLDSSVDPGVDRLALLRSWVPGLIALDEVSRQPVFSDAAQEVMVRYSSDLPIIGSTGMAPFLHFLRVFTPRFLE